MKKLLLIFLLIHTSFLCEGQSWQWVQTYDYGNEDRPRSFGRDEIGNLYMLCNEYYDHGASAHNYMYLGKYDPYGVEVWRDTVPAYLKSAVTDKDGNTYCNGGQVVVKYDSNGNLQWTSAPLMAPITPSICYSSVNDQVLACAFGYVSGLITSSIASYKPDGTVNWYLVRDSSAAKFCAADPTGNFFVISSIFKDTLTGNKCDLTKYDDAGNLLFCKVIPHIPDDMVCDKDGNIYIAGSIKSVDPTNIDGTLYSMPPFGSSNPNTFLLKYDAGGNLLWYKLMRNARCPLATDKNGFLYLVAGGKSVEIDSLSVIETNAFQLVVKLDGNGNIIWSTHTSTNAATGTISQICVLTDSSDNIYLAGGIRKQHYFGSLPANGESSYDDNYIAKLSQAAPTVGLTEPLFISTDLKVSPNPSQGAVTVSYAPSGFIKELNLWLRNAEGKQLYFEKFNNIGQPLQRSIDLSTWPSGVYLVELEADGLKMVKKVVVN
jgi:hypothetical protein